MERFRIAHRTTLKENQTIQIASYPIEQQYIYGKSLDDRTNSPRLDINDTMNIKNQGSTQIIDNMLIVDRLAEKEGLSPVDT
jgi:hypothetical protein